MLKEVLTVGEITDIDTSKMVLLLQVGDYCCGFGIMQADEKRLQFYSMYECDAVEEELLDALFQKYPVIKYRFRDCAITYFTNPSVQVPSAFFKQENVKEYVSAVYPFDNMMSVLAEQVPSFQLQCVYAVQQDMNNKLSRTFLTGKYWHHCSVALKTLQPGITEGFFINFWQQSFTVVVIHKGQFRLCQKYKYKSPEDVLYHLLKICRLCDMDQQNVKLVLGGLIDQRSVLYSELYKFFVHIEFEKIPGGLTLSDAFNAFPDHYFSSVCKLASCV